MSTVGQTWYRIIYVLVVLVLFCAFCFVFYNFLRFFVLHSFNLQVSLICAIKHLLTYLLTYYILYVYCLRTYSHFLHTFITLDVINIILLDSAMRQFYL